MISPRAAIAAFAVAGVLSAQETPPRTPAGLFHGWVLEHLYRDIDGARAEYEKVANDRGAAREERAVARARLVELSQILGRASEIDSNWPPDAKIRAGAKPSPLQLPRAALERALSLDPGPERDAELTRVREEVGLALDPQRPRFRNVVHHTLTGLEKDDSDRLRILRAELQVARKQPDTAKLRELRLEILRVQGLGIAGESSRRTTPSWRVFITRRLLEGRIERAEQIRRRLGLPRYGQRPAPGDEQRFVDELRATVRRHVATAAIPQIERDVLLAVMAQLDEFAREGRWREAAELAAPLPYDF